jgi:hypothetical protein
VAQYIQRALLRPRTFVLVTGLFIAYVAYAEASAHWSAKAFCRQTTVGSSTERLAARAVAEGAVDLNNQAAWDESVQPPIQWKRSPNSNVAYLPVTFPGFAAQVQHICVITAVDGVVAYGEVKHLD